MKDNKLGIMPISKLIWNMSLPIIVSMLVLYLCIAYSQAFVHKYGYHIQYDKREPHTEISGGNPKNRTTASGRSWGFGCFHLYLSIKVVEFGYNRR